MNINRYTEKLQEALGRAQNAAVAAHHQAVDIEHLAAAFLEDEEGLGASILKIAGADLNKVRAQLKDELRKIPSVSGSGADAGQTYVTQRLNRVLTRAEQEAGKLKKVRGNQRVTSQNPEATYQALERYGRDLTQLAAAGKLDPVIGRDEEIRRVIQILSRRTKNNPVLIGEPGVGKTAIVEGLAQ